MTLSKLALELDVSVAYVFYIVERMDDGNKHLLPTTSKSKKVQKAINKLIEYEVKLIGKNIQK